MGTAIIRGRELFNPTHSYKTITAPIAASKTTKNVKKFTVVLMILPLLIFLDLIKIMSVTISKIPLIDLWENSITSDVSDNWGITFPLHVGHVDPHPSPEPVALTNAPAKIDNIDRRIPSFV